MTAAELPVVTALGLVALTSLVLFAYGLNLLYLSWLSLRLPYRAPRLVAAGQEPEVTVQLPVYNERYVAERVIDATARLDWPATKLEVQVLDDSDDDTVAIVAARVAHWRCLGVNIVHVRRTLRSGYKAGALAHGMALSQAPLFAVFDSDFVPPPDFLRRTLGGFDDPRVGFVQARWGHVNETYSWLTRLQSLSIDFHFLVEQAVRSRGGYFTNFTGTAGVWRRSAIVSGGGWSAATLTEDLDLSYRAQLAGWTAFFVEDLVVPQELPVAANAYRAQQSRWAQGSFQCAWRLLNPVLRRAPRPWQATVHLLSYAIPVLMLIQLACYPLLLAARADHDPLVDWVRLPLALNLISLAPSVAFTVAQVRRRRRWWHGAPGLLCQVIGAGMSLTVSRALLRSTRGGGEFMRTPKYRIEQPRQEWVRASYRAPLDGLWLAELGLGVGGLIVAAGAAVAGELLMAAYACLIAAGFLAVAGAGFGQSFGALLAGARRRGPA